MSKPEEAVSVYPIFFFFKIGNAVSFQMGVGAPRMGQPNAVQLQNQYLPPGQFPGSSPGRGSGMNQPGTQTAVPVVRISVNGSFLGFMEFMCLEKSQA